MREIVGRKVGMTRLFDEAGTAFPVSVIAAGPCPVVARRTVERDGHDALAVGFETVKPHHVTKPQAGQFKRSGVAPARLLTEVAVPPDFEEGEGVTLTVEMFKVGERVDVSGISIGKGWQGVMRRHHFGGVGDATHGQSDRLRAPGSIGQSSYPSRVFKGLRMAGQMGGRRATIKNLLVVGVDAERSLLLVRGAVPGKANNLLRIRGA
jgi:large subunit ribosomal protein L3